MWKIILIMLAVLIVSIFIGRATVYANNVVLPESGEIAATDGDTGIYYQTSKGTLGTITNNKKDETSSTTWASWKATHNTTSTYIRTY